ncbi:MAG: Fe-S cluster assembly sulfur transfer protein SufU [Evtepia sp.]
MIFSLNLKMNGDVIEDASFQGDGCAISQASADMMIDLVLGKTKQEALELADRFLRMIRGEATEAEKSPWTKPAILEDVSHMPARVKCATLGWHTIQEMLKDIEPEALSPQKTRRETEAFLVSRRLLFA